MVTKTSSGMAVCRAVRIWIMLRLRLNSYAPACTWRSRSTVSDQSALRTAVIIDLVFLFEFLELLDHPVVLVVLQGYQRLAFTAQDQNPILVGLGLQDVVRFAFDLHDVVDDVAFLF